MGDFRITIDAVGGHGCMRELGDGETVIGCDRPGCPDCITREYVRRLKRSGAMVSRAMIEHWPQDLWAAQPPEIDEGQTQLITVQPGVEGVVVHDYREKPGPVDNLLTGKRRGDW